jgi:hypothetical protein
MSDETSAAPRHSKVADFFATVTIGLAIAVALASVISALWDEPLSEALRIALAASLGLSAAGLVTAGIYGRMIAGGVLFDCGPSPGRRYAMAAFVIYLGMGALYSYDELKSGNPQILTFIGNGAIAVLLGTSALARLQIRENGLWIFFDAIKWNKIQSYRWEGDRNSTLVVQAQSRFPSHRKATIPVPDEHKDAVDELLRSRVGAAA